MFIDDYVPTFRERILLVCFWAMGIAWFLFSFVLPWVVLILVLRWIL